MTALLLLAALAAPPPSVYVVSIGHNGAIGDGRAPLRYADDDAIRMYELLAPGATQAALLTVPDPASQRVFPEAKAVARPPTRREVEATLMRVRRAIEADKAAGRPTVLYWFYAGHGDVADGQGYVGLEGGRWTRADLRRWVIEGPADRTHVIIDACKSYFLVGGRGPGGKATPYLRPFGGPQAPPGVGFVLSTSSDAESHEWGAIPGGVFAHEVRSGLLGAADIGGDGAVDYEELAAFVGLANAAVPVARYQPRVWIRAPRADARAVIFRPSRLPGATQLEMAPERTGRLEVYDQRGLRYLDAHKARGVRLTVGLLAPRRYEVRTAGRIFSVQADGQALRLADATPTNTAIAARSEAHRAYEQLFATPFGTGALQGFRVGRDQVEVAPPLAAAPDWLTPTLVGGGVVALGAGLGLVWASGDTQVEASRAAQADRPALNDEADALALGASVAIGLGVTALAVAAWRYWSAP